ncbi:hypothetical protein D8834_03660 [Streptococcus oralis]|nr:hypothetical protein D8834_03660 [Streptococcus oralis]
MLGCLGSLHKDQTIIITFANFFQRRSCKGTWASTLDIACLSHADISIFLGNQTSCINLDCFRSIFQSTQTWCRKFLFNLTKFFLHEIVHSPFITNDSRKHGNLFTQFCFFFLQDNHVCIGQTVKLQGNDGLSLLLSKLIADLEVFLGVSLILRSTDKGNDFIQNRDNANQTFHDMETFFGLFLVKARTRQDHFTTVGNIARQYRHNANLTRGEIVNRNHVEVVVDLQVSVFEEIVKNQLGIRIFLKFNSDTKTVTVRLITNLSNTSHLVIDTNIIDFLDEISLIDFIRNLSDNDLFLTTF